MPREQVLKAEIEPIDQRAGEIRLMARVAERDAAAFAMLVDSHLGPILNFAARTLGNRDEAEDIAQETMLRLWQNAGRWRPQAKLTTWLHRIAYNLCIDHIRKDRGTSLDEAPEPIDEAESAVTSITRAETAGIVADAIEGLPPRQRIAVTLVHFQELSNIDAAEIMEISVEALESLLARGRRRLRERLDNQKKFLLSES